MKSFPELTTKRLRLRKPEARDILQIIEWADNPKVANMTLNIPHPYREEDAIKWISTSIDGWKNQTHVIFAVCSLSADQCMGGIGLRINKRFNRAALGFWLGEPFWNRGYMTEAVRRVLRFGFKELDLNKIYATHLTGNPASGKVMEKNGMRREGTLTEHFKQGEKYLSVVQYGLTRAKYQKRKAK